MIEPSLARKVKLIANTRAIQDLSPTERAALAYSIQKAGSFEKLSLAHQELIEHAQAQLTEYDYRFVLDVDECD